MIPRRTIWAWNTLSNVSKGSSPYQKIKKGKTPRNKRMAFRQNFVNDFFRETLKWKGILHIFSWQTGRWGVKCGICIRIVSVRQKIYDRLRPLYGAVRCHSGDCSTAAHYSRSSREAAEFSHAMNRTTSSSRTVGINFSFLRNCKSRGLTIWPRDFLLWGYFKDTEWKGV